MITAEKLRAFAIDNPHRVFSVKETSRGLVPDYVRSINRNLAKHHVLIAYADVVLIYDRNKVAEGNGLAGSVIARYPVEPLLCRLICGLGNGVGCYYSGLLAEALRLLPKFDRKSVSYLISRVRSQQSRFLKEYYPSFEERMAAAQERKWLLDIQKPPSLKLQS